MSTILIEESKRAGARLLLGLAGASGDGKTFSALLMAYGLAGCDARKVGLLDCENKRGSLYSDILPGGQRFRRGDLYEPFSPQRYIDAIKAFQAAGVEVLVIDSVTHEWEGPGGCEDIAHKSGKKMADWLTAKREHKRFMSALLLCDMHVICCIRAREKSDFTNPAKPVSLGIQPICEKNFMFEMTASFMMQDRGRRREILKCPGDLESILGRTTGYIGIEEGKALRAWVDGAGADPLEPLRNRLRLAASEGTEALKAAWEGISKQDRQSLGAEFVAVLKSQAVAVDAAEAQSHQRYGHEDAEAPEGREALLAALQAKCAAGNGYGISEAQVLTYLGTDSFEKITDSELKTFSDDWPNQVALIAKEGK